MPVRKKTAKAPTAKRAHPRTSVETVKKPLTFTEIEEISGGADNLSVAGIRLSQLPPGSYTASIDTCNEQGKVYVKIHGRNDQHDTPLGGGSVAGESDFPMNSAPQAPRDPHLDMCDVIQKVMGSHFKYDADIEDTAARFIKYLREFSTGVDPRMVLGTLFEGAKVETVSGLIVQNNIPFRMICEHHLLPAMGHAWIGYIPRRKVVGLSKLARLVEAVGTRRPGMQETICEEITDTLHNYVDANGTITVIRSLHSCMACRGVHTPDVATTTSCVRGLFRDVPQVRSEFFSLAGLTGGIK